MENIYLEDRRQTKEREGCDGIRDSKISPVLREWLAFRSPDDRIEVIVTFQEDLTIPRLPELEPDESREKGRSRRAKAIEEIRQFRAQSIENSVANLEGIADFVKLDMCSWIVKAVVLETALSEIESLATAPEVIYVQPVKGGEAPPQGLAFIPDATDGRGAIFSDPYFHLGLSEPWIGLIDTGVRDTHDMFNSPDHIDWMRDCVNGDVNCVNATNPLFATDWFHNHGTQSAGILTGNAQIDPAFRGVTEVLTDSWQVYTSEGSDAAAACRAIGEAAKVDAVIVCETEFAESENGVVARAADNAYDAGAILVAANGNHGTPFKSVRSPAIAHKVLGIGAFETDSRDLFHFQSRGPANDGRYKPDIQAPTGVETSSNDNDSALGTFGSTSCATAFAGGAAMLARNWLRRYGTNDNGQTYAFMILYGQNEWPYDNYGSTVNTVGAGPIEMATDGWAWWGKVSAANHMTIDIPIVVPGGKFDLDVALWWAESANQPHNDIDVYLVDPAGVEKAASYSWDGVFERTGVSGALQSGFWTVRIRGYNVKTLAQPVYWAAHVRNVGRDPVGGDPIVFGKPMRIFAGEAFYVVRNEPEEILFGVLHYSWGRPGDGERDTRFRLMVGDDEYAVFEGEFEKERLRPYVDRRVKVSGKRVNLRPQGYGVEIWMGNIALDDR